MEAGPSNIPTFCKTGSASIARALDPAEILVRVPEEQAQA